MVRSAAVRWVLVVGCLLVAPVYLGFAQAPAGRGAAAQQPRVYANMLQLMRSVLYPPPM